MSKSTWDDPRITAYVLGGLSKDEHADFEKELGVNAELAAAVEEAKGLTAQLQSFYDTEKTPSLDQQRRDAIVSGDSTAFVTPATAPESQSPSGSWRVTAVLLAAAAVLMLLVGVAPWLRDQDRTVVQDTSPQSDLQTDAAPSSSRDAREDVGKNRTEDLAIESERLTDSTRAEARLDLNVEQSDIDSDAIALKADVIVKEKSMDVADVADVELLKQIDASAGAAPALAASDLADQPRMKKSAPPAPPQSDSMLERVLRRSRNAMPNDAIESASGGMGGGGGGRGVRSLPIREAIKAVDADKVAPVPASSAALNVPNTPAAPAPAAPARAEPKTAEPAPVMEMSVEKDELFFERKIPKSVKRETAGKAIRQGQVQMLKKGVAVKSSIVPDDAGFGRAVADGEGPGKSGDQFTPITDNPFFRVSEQPQSTFSIDVDTASYSKTRDFLMRAGQLPRPDAVRIEEFVNYFDYDYKAPASDAEHPFAVDVAITSCPWNEKHRLARVALQGKTMKKAERPPCNLVFLLDTSGSMNAPNKLPLVVEGMKMLTDQLREQDRVAIAVYAGSAGLVLDSVSAKKKKQINRALTALSSGGSTDGGSGITLAYETARDHFIADGVNRVILCTDGDFNVGVTGTDALVRMVEKESKGGIFLSVLGFGMGNHNDAMLEQISGRGNGNYAFIDTQNEAKKVLVDQTSGTLVTIAKDVKLQLEFNVKNVSQYRLIGYENRILAAQDFADDKKDAGEIGAGHSVTALYEIVPAGVEADASPPKQDDLRYQATNPTEAADSDELLQLALRYKQPDGDKSTEVIHIVKDDGGKFENADIDVRFAAAVAGFGMQLRKSSYAGSWTMADVLRTAIDAKGKDKFGLRAEFVQMIRKASEIIGGE